MSLILVFIHLNDYFVATKSLTKMGLYKISLAMN